MLEKALEILNLFNENGYEAYIVGGFVRNYVIGKESTDIDIATSATPMQIKEIFKDVTLPTKEYGSVDLVYKKTKFEVTTYRMDLEYKNNRHPSKIMYTDKLEIDLKRRDFTMNTLCMDKEKNIIDLLGGMKDVKNHVIRCVGNADKRLKEDSLRILRAIRFATVLGFNIDYDLKNAIGNNRELLEKLSFYRKKQELNKIFSSSNAIEGIKIIKKYKLDEYLGINIDDKIVKTNDPIGIWAQVNPVDDYQFTNNEVEYIDSIKRILKDKNISDMELYKEGTYVCYIAGQILGIDEVEIYNRFDKLPITKSEDIKMSQKDIIEYLKLDDKSKVKEIFKDIEEKIISRNLINDSNKIKEYLNHKYMI